MLELAEVIRHRFVERDDVHAVQAADGGYRPSRRPLDRERIAHHLDHSLTLGNYLVSPVDLARFVAFDIDLTHEGHWTSYEEDGPDGPQACDPRQVWTDQTHPGIPSLTHTLRSVASALAGRLRDWAEVPVAVAYSGSKGLHVYGFTGPMEAGRLRELAFGVLGSFATRGTPDFVPSGRPSAVRSMNTPNYEIEVFPKQATTGGGLGNLLRLPLGINRKSGHEAFIVDQRAPLRELVAVDDPLQILMHGDQS